MKSKTFSKSTLILLLMLSFLFSCKENNHSIVLLRQAQKIIESNPSNALVLLDSIHSPQAMPEREYMEYIVTRTQAKFKTQQDIKNDTLIIDASNYFFKRDDINNAALAYLYTGLFFLEKEIQDKALENFKLAENFSKKANDDLLIARSQHNIGAVYFNHNELDSAIIYYKQALIFYHKYDSISVPQLHMINQIGRSFEALNKFDSAYIYFSKGLMMSEQFGSLAYKSKFNRNIGVVYFKKNDYNASEYYLKEALLQSLNAKDSLSIYLNLSILYNSKKQIDSTRYYTDLIKQRISEIKDDYVLEYVYGSLYEYNKRIGNFEKALHYIELQKVVKENINERYNAEKLLNAETNYKLYIEKQKQKSEREYFLLIQIIIILTIVAVFYFITIKRRHKHQKNAIENRRLKVENRLLKQEHDSHIYLESIYQQYILKWAKIENRVNKLGVEDEQVDLPLYTEIKSMSDELKSHTNKQLLKLAKSYLHSHSDIGEKAVRVLTEQELILMILCYFEYSKVAIATILDIKLEKLDLDERKLRIATRLKRAGIAEYDINLILYSEKM